MPATLEIEKETAEMLAAQAEARGLSVDDYLRSLLKATSESDLLRRIKNRFPESQRLRELTRKSEAETLSDEERAEYIALAEQREAVDAERMQAVAKLAQLRGVSPDQLLNELGLGANTHG
ncbi:MAG: hypothetical protein L0229_08065 [Blastocatellia bacterium]|nr:hypothetical protein [Blastocatellia bacterium]